MLKKTLITLYIVAVVVLAAATIIEKYTSTAFVASHIYGAWWFVVLWALLTAAAIAWFVKRRVRRPSVVLLHLSFAVILLGALLTWLTSWSGQIVLTQNEPTNTYLEQSSSPNNASLKQLPFSLKLDSFCVEYHSGTASAADYVSYLTIIDGHEKQSVQVSMNHIVTHRNVRIYQSSYDSQRQQSGLTLYSDPWGIGVTYIGYALLFISFVLMSIEYYAKSKKRRLCMALLLLLALPTHAATTLTPDNAKQLGQVCILYNGRICPMQTYALDLTKKLTGRRHYGEYSAEQVLAGFMLWPQEWDKEPLLKIKSRQLREACGLRNPCAVSDLFRADQGGYVLGPLVEKYYQGNQEKLYREAAKMDERLQMLMQLRMGESLKIFPYKEGRDIRWMSPASVMDSIAPDAPTSMEPERRKYIQTILAIIQRDATAGNNMRVSEALHKIKQYQATYGGNSLPSASKQRAEHLYNKFPFTTILFILCFVMAAIAFGIEHRAAKQKTTTPAKRSGANFQFSIFHFQLLLLLALTFFLLLRWHITGTVPMSNGYETTLLLAWLVLLITLFVPSIPRSFGFLLAGIFLLVSHISQMDPQMTPLMPVLNSPLLCIHVSIIMTAYALLSLVFINSLCALFSAREPQMSSLLLLYPALAALALGIFTGAVWANVSWGRYWSWDPKETWALITLMIYAVPVHRASLPCFRRPRVLHIYLICSYLAVLITWLGVNYLLGGMHSYA